MLVERISSDVVEHALLKKCNGGFEIAMCFHMDTARLELLLDKAPDGHSRKRPAPSMAPVAFPTHWTDPGYGK